MMLYQRPIIACFLFAACAVTSGEAEPKAVFRADETDAWCTERMAWWREANLANQRAGKQDALLHRVPHARRTAA